VKFHPFASFVNSCWHGGAALPDPAIGWTMLNANGGHAGDAAHQAIRRWVAPAAGTLHVEGVLSHSVDKGDGVRGRIVAKRGGLVGAWEAHHSEAMTSPSPISVEPGDAVDFITDCRRSVEHDSFTWIVTLRLTSTGTGKVDVWHSVSGFHGPLVPPMSRWEQLAQVLLMSNEFAFVD